jgi:hypothetical protein
MPLSRLLVAPILALLCVRMAAAQTSLIVSDGFSDAPGAITGDYGGYGWQYQHDWTSSDTSSPNLVTSGGLTFSTGGQTLTTSGNKLTTIGNDEGSYRRPPTDFGPYGGLNNQDIWISFLSANTSASTNGNYAGLSLFYNGAEQFFIGVPATSDAYGFQNDSLNNSNPDPQVLDPGFLPPDTTTHFLVTHLSFSSSGTTEVAFYVDPTPGISADDGFGNQVPTQAPAVDYVYTTAFNFDQIRFQSGGTTQFNFDEFRMANDYLSVAPADATPEPTVIVYLLGPAVGALFALRRRRAAF